MLNLEREIAQAEADVNKHLAKEPVYSDCLKNIAEIEEWRLQLARLRQRLRGLKLRTSGRWS